MSQQRIYLDHAATTPTRPEAAAAMLASMNASAYNPSSLHAEGRAARAALDAARDEVARLLHAQRREIVFTGSGSEADNLAIVGTARARRDRGNHLLATAIEHHAVLHALDALRDEGFEVTLLGVDSSGRVDPQVFAAALRPTTILATVMLANNEIGTLQPVAELAALAHAAGVLFHTDAIQAPAYLPLDVDRLGVDLLSLSGHKFYGPKGVGALYVRRTTTLRPLVFGGGQEFALRAGTENVAGIAGFARALALAVAERLESVVRIEALRDRLEAEVVERVAGVRVNAAGAPRLPNVASIAFPGGDAQGLLMSLDLAGVAVSTGSACTAGAVEPSHVLAAIGLAAGLAGGTLRFSLGRATTVQEIDAAARIVAEVART